MNSLTSVAAFHYLVAGCPDYRGRSDPAGEFVDLNASRAERPVLYPYQGEENGEGSIHLVPLSSGFYKVWQEFQRAATAESSGIKYMFLSRWPRVMTCFPRAVR